MEKGLLEEMRDVSEKLEKLIKEETGYDSFEELLTESKNFEEFDKQLDKVLERVKKDKNLKDEKLKAEKLKASEKAEKFKEEKGIKEDMTGTAFKTYETKDGSVCVEARGCLTDILSLATKG